MNICNFCFLIINTIDDCIFCKIIKWESPCIKIRQNEHFMAFFDVFPNTRWQTIVIPKFHRRSDVFTMESKTYGYFMDSVKTVVEILKSWLGINRIAMVMEWMWVNHAHIKLYPMRWVNDDRKLQSKQFKIFFEEYMWFLVTKSWPKVNIEELQDLASKITWALPK